MLNTFQPGAGCKDFLVKRFMATECMGVPGPTAQWTRQC
jgi:hypothetical protein